jgi:hypothetical protein
MVEPQDCVTQDVTTGVVYASTFHDAHTGQGDTLLRASLVKGHMEVQHSSFSALPQGGPGSPVCLSPVSVTSDATDTPARTEKSSPQQRANFPLALMSFEHTFLRSKNEGPLPGPALHVPKG